MNTLNRRLATAITCLFGFAAQPALAANFVVNTNADSGTGSFRWALQQAAATPLSMDTITFNLPPGQLTITPLTDLPNVFYVSIDARTQPGYMGKPVVRIDGSQRSGDSIGLRVNNNGTVIGFSIVNFSYAGVQLGAQVGTPGYVLGSFIGVQPDGVTAGPNGRGIWVTSQEGQIGGVGSGYGNVISGNTAAGIDVYSNSSNVHISNNVIGATANGMAALPNGTDGITSGGIGIQIGDINSDERNIIAGNVGCGIYINGANHTVLGNWIGLNVLGAALPNGCGVTSYGDNTRIGDGAQAAGGNVISGNTGNGVYCRFVDGCFVERNYIGTDPTGLLDRGNGNHGIMVDASTTVSIGGPSAQYRNYIGGNGAGVYISGVPPHASMTTVNVQNNYIGIGVDGNTMIPNANGLLTYAGEIAISDNLISGNTGSGLYLRGGNHVIEDNLIGTDPTGMSARANGGAVYLGDAQVHVERNIMAGNNNGIAVSGSLAEGTFLDNRIGVNGANAKLGNGGSNFRFVYNKPGFVIGAPGKGNKIGASLRGIVLDDTSEGVIIQSNFIGWIPGAPGKDIGHTESGILGGGRNHQIGGDTLAERNVISRNTSTGIHLSGSGHRIQGNWIGSDTNNTAAIGNRNGIVLDDAFDVLVGGADAEGNVIRNNQDTGLLIRGQGITALSNRIYGNGLLPIDLIGTAGLDANDAGDFDPGSNGMQNAPVIESAVNSGGNMHIEAHLESQPFTQYTVQFFNSPACHGSGGGEATTLLGTTVVLSDNTGGAYIPFNAAATAGVVSATATDALGNTSELGNCVAVGPASPGQIRFSQATYYGFEVDGHVQFVVTRSGGATGAVSVTVTTQAQTATAGADFTAATQTINFFPYETVKTVSVALNDDGIVEPYEQFLVILSNPTGGATLGASTQSTAYIVSNDSGTIRVSSSDITISEPASGQAMAVFTVTMDAHVGERTVSFTTESGSATADVDFISTSGELVFAEGETSKTISVETDAQLDPDVVRWEPAGALFAGADGLDDYRILVPQLPGLLDEGGAAVLEIGAAQAGAVREIAERTGFSVELRCDLGGRPRALILRLGLGNGVGTHYL
jgi:hypothetical protein